MYIDIMKKLNFEKERIVKAYIMAGICPSQEEVREKLSSIDASIALFKHYDKTPGSLFDVEEYNNSMALIYKDIKILYEILIDFLEKEYSSQQKYIKSYMHELESLADTCYERAVYESSSTSLGNTLLYKNNKFELSTKDNSTFIDLGSIGVREASTVMCLVNGSFGEKTSISFEFTNEKTGDVLIAPAYNKHNEHIVFPGKRNIVEHVVKIDKNQVTDNGACLTIDNINSKSKYEILGAENNISYNNEIIKAPTVISEYRFEDGGDIDFYVVNGSTVSFSFNKKPLSANFTIQNNIVKDIDRVHHFFMEVPKDFQFSITLDKGKVFASKEHGIVSDNKIIYNGHKDVKDFLILEETEGKSSVWSSVLKIIDNNEENIELESVIIKEKG